MHFQAVHITVLLVLTATANAAVAACGADNCYRALFPCSSAAAWSTATSFCATLTAGPTTATNYPTRATSACGTVPARYISACACGPTCTPTPNPCPPLGLVPNGDFECGITPWTVQVPDSAAETSIVSTANTGSKAFNVHTRSAPISPELGVSARIISAAIPVAAGVPAKLTFASFFDNGDAGFIGVLINGAPVRTVDARDRPVGVWNVNEVDYTPTGDEVVITFEFLFGVYPSNMRIDTVGFAYLH